ATGTNLAGSIGDFAAETQVQVDAADVTGISLTLHEVQPVTLTGKIVTADGTGPPPVTVGLQRSSGALSARTQPDGTFEFKGLLPDRYTIRLAPVYDDSGNPPRLPVGVAHAAKARLGSCDVLKNGFELDGAPPPPLEITLASKLDIWTSGRL